MLIICNGAFKSGSSWLHAILVELSIVKKLNLQNVPNKYTNDVNSPTTVIESQLEDFLLIEDFNFNNYLTKSHFFKKRTLRRQYSDNVKALSLQAGVQIQREEKQKAINTIGKLISLDKSNIRFRLLLINLLLNEEPIQKEQIISLLDEVLRIAPDNSRILAKKAAILIKNMET